MELFIQFTDMEEVKVGDVVSTTTSNFPYDNCYGCFMTDDRYDGERWNE